MHITNTNHESMAHGVNSYKHMAIFNKLYMFKIEIICYNLPPFVNTKQLITKIVNILQDEFYKTHFKVLV